MSHNDDETTAVPPLGPKPTLLSRKEVDALYETLAAAVDALQEVRYIVTGGTLLGAVRQHSLLFCDDDVDIAIVHEAEYETARERLSSQLDSTQFRYQVRPWEGGDRIRHVRMNNVYVDLFCLRRYESRDEMFRVVGVKKNGHPQSSEYVNNLFQTMQSCVGDNNIFPLFHFSTRKAIELWPKEVYRPHELFPLCPLKYGPLTVMGPRMPVRLLRRAFGTDCFDVYYPSASHATSGTKLLRRDQTGRLPPRIQPGGQWETSHPAPLLDEHYLPVQPSRRSQRRWTLHNKNALQDYLATQQEQEQLWLQQRRTVYMDGVFDLFHTGHLQAIQQCADFGQRVIIGVTGDADATGYKRRPIMDQEQRSQIVAALRLVDKVVCPCPLIVTEEFMNEHDIDLVVHGFCNAEDAQKQQEFFAVPMARGQFQEIRYCHELSTTDIIHSIQKTSCSSSRPTLKWFGDTVAQLSNHEVDIPYDPFPLNLRRGIESHIEKARCRRRESLAAIRQATGVSTFDEVMRSFRTAVATGEGKISFDTDKFALKEMLLQTGTVSNMALLHDVPAAKEKLFRSLTQHCHPFQVAYDSLVRSVCVPHLARLFGEDSVYYQAFPCIRIIQPEEFSIGPHSDVAYGHHPCSINYYAPITDITRSSAALFLESREGSEDWHPILADYGTIHWFPGAVHTHWTTNNTSGGTRVSLDFRLIPGSMYNRLLCGGEVKGGQRDVYRSKAGYYSCCRKDENGAWVREGQLLQPDARIGYPWTVKKWKLADE